MSHEDGDTDSGQMIDGARTPPATIEETLRDFWATRPVRPRSGGKLGGVAAALGRRYGIDPMVLRVTFVVALLFSGAGALLYLLGWLLFPGETEPDPRTGEPRVEPTSGPTAVLLVLLMLPTVVWVQSFKGITGTALGLLGLYLLHRTYGNQQIARGGATGPSTTVPGTAGRPEPGDPPEGAQTLPVQHDSAPEQASRPESGTDESTWGDREQHDAASRGEADRTPEVGPAEESAPSPSSEDEWSAPTVRRHPMFAPESEPIAREPHLTDETRYDPAPTDPSGTVPLAHGPPGPDDPGLTPPEPEPPRRPRNRKVTLVTLLLAVLAAATAVGIGLPPDAALALTLGVLGVGMLVGSVLRGGRGLIVAAVPVGLLAMVASVISWPAPGAASNLSFGEHHIVVNDAVALNQRHNLGVGAMELDLRDLPAQDVPPVATVDASVGVGTLRVLAPPELRVTAHCAATMGDVTCLGEHDAGTAARSSGSNAGQGEEVTLNLRTGAGNVEVIRAR